MLFIKELCQNFKLSDTIRDVAIALDNLRMKTGNKIATYNIDFIKYLFQLE